MEDNKVLDYQLDIKKFLEKSYKKNRLSNVYLFCGDRGSFKHEMALYLANLILEEDGKNNQNFFEVFPENEVIKKEQIANLTKEFSLTSQSKRVFIINDIDKTNLSSSNSLLKFFEEINENIYGVLLTENVNNVLPTIVSRAQVVHFPPIDNHVFIKILTENGVELEMATYLSIITRIYDQAIALTKDKVFLEIIAVAKKIVANFSVPDYAVITLIKEAPNLLTENSKTYHNYFLDILIKLQYDKIKCLLGNKSDVAFEFFDLSDFVLEKEIKILEIMMELKTRIKYNINMNLAYFDMLIKVREVLQ